MALHSMDDARYNIELNNIIQDINNGYRVLIILRGLPGSGKSSLAHAIIENTVKYSPLTHILSTDDYFMSNNIFKYDVGKLKDAHEWNQRRANQYLVQGISPLIIDNTNTELWEMRPYATSGAKNGYIIKILEPKTAWAFNPGKLAQKNCHGVGIIKIKKMMERFQGNVSVDQLLKLFDIKYPPQYKSPILRSAPSLTDQMVKNYSEFKNEQVSKINGFTQKPIFPAQLNVHPTCIKPANAFTNMQARSNNRVGLKNTQVDLIDFSDPDDWVITESVKNTQGCEKNANLLKPDVASEDISSDSNDSWNDGWTGGARAAKPKPQREPNKKLLKTDEKPNIYSEVNWEPIDISLSNWDNCQSLDMMMLSPNNSSKNTNNCDASTNTTCFDNNAENSEHLKVLSAKNRDINMENSILPNILKSKLTLDKGIMTTEENIYVPEVNESTKLQSLDYLKTIFSDIPEDYMSHMLNKCNGNLSWTIEILLDATKDSNFTDLSAFTPKKVKPVIDNDVEIVNDVEIDDKITGKRVVKNESKFNKCPKKDKVMSEQSVELKKKLEGNFQFSDDHYSEHSLKLKRKIHGESSTSVCVDLTQDDPNKMQFSKQVRSNSESSDEPENMVSFRMGQDFFAQLDKIYGMNTAWDNKLEPIIHIPESLVNQIHALWLESVCNQIDVQKEAMKAMIQEDEELARELEAKERQQGLEGVEPNVGNLIDIMDMEIAFAHYNSSISQWEQSPEDLASKLTRQKLCQMFPEIDEDILLDIYKAHNNNFEQTFYILLLNTNKISPSQTEGIDQKAVKKLLAEMERELLERANREKEKDLLPDIFNDNESLNIVNDDGSETMIDNKTAVQYFRQQAQHHLQIRNQNVEKARECILKGMVPAATYYSQIAALHAKKHDYANNLAASRLLQASTMGNDSYTLDLHHLFVTEALQVLDMFLDKHISALKDSDSNMIATKLFLITGRGRHSPGGQARIKPAVKKRLTERGLSFTHINPGLLGVCVTSRCNISTTPTVT